MYLILYRYETDEFTVIEENRDRLDTTQYNTPPTTFILPDISLFFLIPGAIHGLQFNPHKESSHLLASGGADGEVYIMSLERPDQPNVRTQSSLLRIYLFQILIFYAILFFYFTLLYTILAD